MGLNDNAGQHDRAKVPIPRRIIQTGKVAPNSVRVRAMVSSVRSLNPGYEYLFFDDSEVEKFISQEFPQYRTVFDSFRFPIQRYDFFRYLVIYRLGGFYFDLDIILALPLDSLLEFSCVFPFEGLSASRYLRSQLGMDWELGNYAFGAAPNDPYLEVIIENCIRGQRDRKWVEPMLRGVPPLSKSAYAVLCTTGPVLISRTLAEHPELARQVKVLIPAGDVCDQKTWNCFGEYGFHLMDGSWRPQSGLIKRVLTRTWQQRKLRSLIRESIVLRSSN
jgi:inositol phosphorylceramide mannosyltransferase catalytic subunit